MTTATSPTTNLTCHRYPAMTEERKPLALPTGGATPKGLFYSSFRSAKMREASPQQRQSAAEILLGHLLMVEIMMSTIVQKYVFKTCATLDELGLMRHNVKRQAKLLRTVSSDLLSRCNAHDRAQVNAFCQSIYPPLVPGYIESGGTLTLKLQLHFYQKYTERINLIYFATKNAIDKMRIPNSDLLSDVFMITMLTQTGIEFYDLICRKTDHLMEGFGRITCVKSHHNEKMLCASKELLRELGCSGELPEKEANDARTLTAQFQRELTSESLLQTIESSITSLRIDYIEYVIASIRLQLSEGKLPSSCVRSLLARLGSTGNVRLLLKEIADIPLPESEEWDVIDFAQNLPGAAPDSSLYRFRQLCVNDQVIKQ